MPRHVEPDDLALLALGERPEGVEAGHVAACAQCQADLDGLRTVVAEARALEPADTPVAPAPHVWDAIRLELGIAGNGAARPLEPVSAGRRTTVLVAAAAALAGIVLGAVVTALVTGDDEAGQVVARARLAPLPERSGTGGAEVVGTGSRRVLELDVSGLTRGAGFYEVWLLDADGTRLVSLGLLDGSTGRYPLPAELDVAQFPVVDVSLEPADGNPAHSGDSVVRGTLAG